MLVLKLYQENNDNAIYNYFPEGNDQCGSIEIDKKNGEVNVISIAQNDLFNLYMHHAVKAVEKFFSSRNYEKKKVIAWF